MAVKGTRGRQGASLEEGGGPILSQVVMTTSEAYDLPTRAPGLILCTLSLTGAMKGGTAPYFTGEETKAQRG